MNKFKLPDKIIYDCQIVRELLSASLKSRFRNTWGGIVWVLLNPIITYSVHSFILMNVLKINFPNAPLYLLGGVLPWTFFATTMEMSPSSLVNSRQLLYSFSVSPFVIISIMVVENFVTFLMSFALLAFVLMFFYQFPLGNIYFFPFAVMLLFLFTVLAATIVAILNVFFRDIKFIVSFGLSLLFFLTPILYPEEKFPVEFKWIVNFNPIYKVILPLRSCIYEFHESISSAQILEALGTILSLFVIVRLIWKKYKNELIKNL